MAICVSGFRNPPRGGLTCDFRLQCGPPGMFGVSICLPNPPVKPAMWRVPLLVILLLLPSQLWGADAVQFETHVRPILKAHCWHCHGETDETKGSLDARLA